MPDQIRTSSTHKQKNSLVCIWTWIYEKVVYMWIPKVYWECIQGRGEGVSHEKVSDYVHLKLVRVQAELATARAEK